MNRVVDELPVQARIPADLDAPDRVMLGLTTRQVAVLAVAVVPIYLAWQLLAGRVPVPVLVGPAATCRSCSGSPALSPPHRSRPPSPRPGPAPLPASTPPRHPCPAAPPAAVEKALAVNGRHE